MRITGILPIQHFKSKKFVRFGGICKVGFDINPGWRWRSWLHYKPEVACSIPDGVELFSSFQSHYGPGIYLASNRNGYQENLLEGTDGRCVEPTALPLSCADCLEILGASTSWNPKGLSRSVQRLIF